ncbi:MAG: hypothetical protein ACJ0Q6_04835 [Candidatus Azotimanducaceae bacterium]
MNKLIIGITEKGILHADQSKLIDLDTRFRMVKESGVYDYYDKTPEDPGLADNYLSLSEKYDVPIRAGGWFYELGKDEQLFKNKLQLSAKIGSKVHNTQIRARHADGHLVTNEEVFRFYMDATELGERCGCLPTLEVHINMWSEDFRRVSEVADMVEERGVPFRMTLDHSHVIFKIDNEVEQKVFDIKSAIESGDLILDPFQTGNICQEWIDRGFVNHCHARAAVPNNPKNTRYTYPDGSPGRGVQYPFFEPQPGQFPADWSEQRLEPWKEVVRQLLRYHAANQESSLGQISTEFIPGPDYGWGHGYSIFDHSVACARWLKATWETISAEEDSGHKGPSLHR